MTKRMVSMLSGSLGLLMMTAVVTVFAQAPADFPDEPDKSMASAHDSFVKGEMDKAAEQIHSAATYVRSQSTKVAKSVQKGVAKAGDDLDRLGQDVKKGSVKSADQLKKTFAQVDNQLAQAWHATAAQAKKTGKDSTAALKNAGAGLEGAAKWSGIQLKAGAQASVEGVKKVGQGVKLGAEEVGNFFAGLGDGIADVGKQLTGNR
jgi:hypothetical protein